MSDKEIKKNKSEEIYNETFLELFKGAPIEDEEILANLGLFITRQNLSRLIMMNDLYKQILGVHGSIFEFGVRWGQNLSLFTSLRGMYGPFNYSRKIIGFDTFAGFPSVSANDKINTTKVGDLKVSENYENYLEKLLQSQEKASPISHIKKFELVKGDATLTCKEYLKKHPETIISFAYFDLDLYEPTKICLELCKDYFVKGSLLAFDELNHSDWPGETVAVKEILGLNKIALKRFPYCPNISYLIID